MKVVVGQNIFCGRKLLIVKSSSIAEKCEEQKKLPYNFIVVIMMDLILRLTNYAVLIVIITIGLSTALTGILTHCSSIFSAKNYLFLQNNPFSKSE